MIILNELFYDQEEEENILEVGDNYFLISMSYYML